MIDPVDDLLDLFLAVFKGFLECLTLYILLPFLGESMRLLGVGKELTAPKIKTIGKRPVLNHMVILILFIGDRRQALLILIPIVKSQVKGDRQAIAMNVVLFVRVLAVVDVDRIKTVSYLVLQRAHYLFDV